MEDYGERQSLDTRYPGYNDSLKMLRGEVETFEALLKQTVEEKDFTKIKPLHNRIKELKHQIDVSQCLNNYAFYRIMHEEAYFAKKILGLEGTDSNEEIKENLLSALKLQKEAEVRAVTKMIKDKYKTKIDSVEEIEGRLSEKEKALRSQIEVNQQQQVTITDLQSKVNEKEDQQKTIEDLQESIKFFEEQFDEVQNMKQLYITYINDGKVINKDFNLDLDLYYNAQRRSCYPATHKSLLYRQKLLCKLSNYPEKAAKYQEDQGNMAELWRCKSLELLYLLLP